MKKTLYLPLLALALTLFSCNGEEERLKEELEVSQEENEKLKDQVEEYESTIQELQSKLEYCADELEECQGNISDLESDAFLKDLNRGSNNNLNDDDF